MDLCYVTVCIKVTLGTGVSRWTFAKVSGSMYH